MFKFGKKKKEEATHQETSNQDDDLALAYGNQEEHGDDSSTGESVPPPPPNANEMKSGQDPGTLQDSDGASHAAMSDLDDDDDDPIKPRALDWDWDSVELKKLLLIVATVVSFIVLLGLSIAYGVGKNKPETVTDASLAAESSAVGSFDLPMTKAPVSATAAPTDPIENEVEEVKEEENPEDTDGEADTPPADIVVGGGDETVAPTSTDSVFVDPQAACTEDGITVLAGCENGVTYASMNYCLMGEVTDQFWEFVRTPPGTAPMVANDWGWIRDETSSEMPFLPEGTFEIGLFSNGEQNLNQYPLITSTEFTISCN